MSNQIYTPKLQLNKAKSQIPKPPFKIYIILLHIWICHKRYDFDFDIVDFPFLDGDVPRRASYTFRNLVGLLESAIMLRTSTLEYF